MDRTPPTDSAPLDCLIVGGGPAGLTAAIYAARFRLRVAVIDSGQSRAALIPCTRNHAGFPGGISGLDLLERMRAQAAEFGAILTAARVTGIKGEVGAFRIRHDGGEITARTVLLATGVINHRPRIADALHAQALARGLLRYCPVCDGFEVIDKKVGVIGVGAKAAKEAEFLRSYTADITIVAPGGPADFDDAQRGGLGAAGIRIVAGAADDFRIEGDRLSLATNNGRMDFESVYPALGSTAVSDLAGALGAARTDEGCIKVDDHQRTSVPGLYAAGDVVIGLDQISHAMGEAGVAATTLRNDLAQRIALLG
jgi:thioredoxin reductase (NADPH)